MVRKGLLWVMRDRLFSRYHGKLFQHSQKKKNNNMKIKINTMLKRKIRNSFVRRSSFE
jgi:hypothetical protein